MGRALRPTSAEVEDRKRGQAEFPAREEKTPRLLKTWRTVSGAERGCKAQCYRREIRPGEARRSGPRSWWGAVGVEKLENGGLIGEGV